MATGGGCSGLRGAVLVIAAAVAGVAAAGAADGAVEYHHRNPGLVDPTAFAQRAHRRRATALVHGAWAALATPSLELPASTVINPANFGADPTGKADSSSGLAAAIKAMTAIGGPVDFQGRVDLGGAVLDLSGGRFLISGPVVIPAGYANFRVQRGTLIASGQYPPTAGEYMLQIGGTGCNSTSGGAHNKDCNTNIGVQQITIDGAGVAWGGLQVLDTMDANIGPAVMVVGFSGVGISLAGTGAGYIHEAWLGQYKPGDPVPRQNATATAILLDAHQHDCDVVNVIVWSGKVGLNSTNGANRIQGVHTWNLSGNQGGYGIVLWGGAGRVQQSYLDFAPLVVRRNIWAHGAMNETEELVMIEGNLFLGTATIVFIAPMNNTELSGVVITGNVFSLAPPANRTIVLDEEGSHKFVSVHDVVIANNEASTSVTRLSTRATKTVVFTPGAASATIDYSDVLLFDGNVGINADSVRCFLRGSRALPLSTTTFGNQVTVHVGGSTDGGAAEGSSVTCSVDQSRKISAADI